MKGSAAVVSRDRWRIVVNMLFVDVVSSQRVVAPGLMHRTTQHNIAYQIVPCSIGYYH